MQTKTVGKLIHRFIAEMNGTTEKPGRRPLGETHEYALEAIAARPIGKKNAAALKKSDIVEYCKVRSEKVCPATINQDITYLGGVLKYAGSAWDDCEEVNAGAIEAARPMLSKHGLVGKSTPRSRRPSAEEIEILLAYFAKQNELDMTEIDMVKVARWQIASTRRVGETCRILWSDWDRGTYTILVHKMKDPKNRDKTKRVALPEAAQAMLEEMWPTRDQNEPRIFPYNAKSVSHRYTEAKKKLGIVDLHLHDSRREGATRLIEESGYSPAEAILATGHETTAIFERTYMRLKPENFRFGPVAKRLQDGAAANPAPQRDAMPDELFAA